MHRPHTMYSNYIVVWFVRLGIWWMCAISLVSIFQFFLYSYIQLTWLLVTEVQSKSFGLVTECCHYNAHPIYASLSYVAHIICFIIECAIERFLCAMRVFEVRASSSSRRLSLCQFHFCRTLHCWLARGEKLHTWSLTHSASLMAGKRSFCFGIYYAM